MELQTWTLTLSSPSPSRRQVLGKKFTKDKIQRAIQLYDSQSPEVMAKLECLFGINDIEWPSEHDRLMGIADKVENSLKKVLFSHGCVFPMFCCLCTAELANTLTFIDMCNLHIS